MKTFRITLLDEGEKFGPYDIQAISELDAMMQAMRQAITESGKSLTLNLKCAVTPLTKKKRAKHP